MTLATIEQGTTSIRNFLEQSSVRLRSLEWQVLDQTTDQRRTVHFKLGVDNAATDPKSQDVLEIIGKFHSDGKACRHEWSNLSKMEQLVDGWRDGELLRELQFGVPRIFFHDESHSILFQHRIAGSSFYQALDRGDFTIFGSAGRSLFDLHQIKPDVDQLVGQNKLLGLKFMSDHVRELIEPSPRVLCESLPQCKDSVNRALDFLAQHDAKLANGVPVSLVHRDFQLRNLLADGSKIWIIDWDKLAFGDPAFDVAYFISYVENHLPNTRAEPAIAEFLSCYGPMANEFSDRIPVYQCFNFLRRACRRFRLRDRDWESEMNRMLRGMDAISAPKQAALA